MYVHASHLEAPCSIHGEDTPFCRTVYIQIYGVEGQGMHQWCSGNINAFQAFALGSISGWCSMRKLLVTSIVSTKVVHLSPMLISMWWQGVFTTNGRSYYLHTPHCLQQRKAWGICSMVFTILIHVLQHAWMYQYVCGKGAPKPKVSWHHFYIMVNFHVLFYVAKTLLLKDQRATTTGCP